MDKINSEFLYIGNDGPSGTFFFLSLSLPLLIGEERSVYPFDNIGHRMVEEGEDFGRRLRFFSPPPSLRPLPPSISIRQCHHHFTEIRKWTARLN